MKLGACLPVFYPEKRVLYKKKNLTRFKTTSVDNLLSETTVRILPCPGTRYSIIQVLNDNQE